MNIGNRVWFVWDCDGYDVPYEGRIVSVRSKFVVVQTDGPTRNVSYPILSVEMVKVRLGNAPDMGNGETFAEYGTRCQEILETNHE